MTRKREYALNDDGITVHDDLTGRETDGHPQYVHTEIAREITVQHTFNPFQVAPFLVGEDSSGYLVSGFNADLLDGLEAAAFAAAIHTHVKADILDLEPIAVVPAADTIPLADGANKIALGWLLTGTGNGLDADLLDGQHAAAFAASADVVLKADYTAADVILVGTGAGTYTQITLAASQFFAKKAAGAAMNITAAEARTILNIADGANVTGDNAPQAHAASHQSAGGDAIRLDDLKEPENNTDLDFSTALHGLVPKGTNVGDYLKDDGTWDLPGAPAHHDSHDPEDGGDALDCAAPAEISVVVVASEGSAHSFARSDHVHAINHGIADNHIVTVDHVTPVATDYARFTANGLEGREKSEVLGDLNVADGADITGANAPKAHAASHVDGTDDIQNATAGQKGLATAAQITKLDGIEALANVTDAINVAAAGAVMDADFAAADEVMVGTGAGTHNQVTLAASQFLAKKAAGVATNVSAADARTILNVADGADVTGDNAPKAHAASHTDGSDDIQNATAGQKGVATAAQITKLDGITALADVTGANPPQAHAASHTDGSDDIRDATNALKGLATAAQITKLEGIFAVSAALGTL